MRWLQAQTNTNQDISSATLIATYTADAARELYFNVLLNQVQGGGDYSAYLTFKRSGSATEYRLYPTTTATVGAGITAIGFTTIAVPVNTGDTISVYVQGVAGDTVTPDYIVDIFENDSLKPTIADRTLDVTAGGEAGLDLDNTSGALGTAQFDANYLTAGLIAANAIDADALATDAADEIADEVWDELIAGHVGAGSTGATLSALAPGAAIVLNSEITEIHT